MEENVNTQEKETPQVAPEVLPKPVKQNKISMMVMSVITILSLALSGYLGYQNMQLKKQIAQTTNASSVTEQSENSKENWKTYVDSNNLYKFNYPSNKDVYFNESKTTGNKTILVADMETVERLNNNDEDGGNITGVFQVSHMVQVFGRPLGQPAYRKSVKREEINLGSKSAVKNTYTVTDSVPNFQVGDTQIEVNVNLSKPSIKIFTPNGKDIALFNQILSTFEFID